MARTLLFNDVDQNMSKSDRDSLISDLDNWESGNADKTVKYIRYSPANSTAEIRIIQENINTNNLVGSINSMASSIKNFTGDWGTQTEIQDKIEIV